MIRIGIELNHVIRNINAQLVKYYSKAFDPMLDYEGVDAMNEDVQEKYLKFEDKYESDQFIYVDYPYEIFGCAKYSETLLPQRFTMWLSDVVANYEKDDVEVVFYGLDEDNLSIQSSFFFLAKFGARVRKVIFPRTLDELFDECDVVVTASKWVLDQAVGKPIICIERGFNEGHRDGAFMSYDNMTSLMDDDKFLDAVADKLKQQ